MFGSRNEYLYRRRPHTCMCAKVCFHTLAQQIRNEGYICGESHMITAAAGCRSNCRRRRRRRSIERQQGNQRTTATIGGAHSRSQWATMPGRPGKHTRNWIFLSYRLCGHRYGRTVYALQRQAVQQPEHHEHRFGFQMAPMGFVHRKRAVSAASHRNVAAATKWREFHISQFVFCVFERERESEEQ